MYTLDEILFMKMLLKSCRQTTVRLVTYLVDVNQSSLSKLFLYFRLLMEQPYFFQNCSLGFLQGLRSTNIKLAIPALPWKELGLF